MNTIFPAVPVTDADPAATETAKTRIITARGRPLSGAAAGIL